MNLKSKWKLAWSEYRTSGNIYLTLKDIAPPDSVDRIQLISALRKSGRSDRLEDRLRCYATVEEYRRWLPIILHDFRYFRSVRLKPLP